MVDPKSETCEIIEEMTDKSPALNGIIGNHINHAHQQLTILLSVLISAILLHDYLPTCMLKSVTVPTIKQKQ